MFPKNIYKLQIVVQSTNIYTSSLLTLFDKPGHVKVERVDYETEYIKESESFPGHGDMLLVAAGGSIDNVVISQDIWRCVWVWVIFVGRVRVVKKWRFLYWDFGRFERELCEFVYHSLNLPACT